SIVADGSGGAGESGGSSGSGGSGGSGGQNTLTPPHPTYPTHPTHAAYAHAFQNLFFSGNPIVARVLAGAGEGVGSNNWVVDGTLTASGRPLLANDPHLGTRLPSTWYLAHVKGGD